MTYSFERATPETLAWVAENARQADVDELWVLTHETPAQVLGALGDRTEIMRVEGQPVCAGGVEPLTLLGQKTGVPWMITTDQVALRVRDFLRGSVDRLARAKGEYDCLVNYVDARNVAAVRWLQWLGFTMHAPEPFGLDGLPFHRFSVGEG